MYPPGKTPSAPSDWETLLLSQVPAIPSRPRTFDRCHFYRFNLLLEPHPSSFCPSLSAQKVESPQGAPTQHIGDGGFRAPSQQWLHSCSRIFPNREYQHGSRLRIVRQGAREALPEAKELVPFLNSDNGLEDGYCLSWSFSHIGWFHIVQFRSSVARPVSLKLKPQ